MAAGRPAGVKTDQTRMWADQVEKLQWLYRVRRISSADFVGPIIEEPLNAAYEEIRDVVDQMKAHEAEQAANDAPELANELGENGGA